MAAICAAENADAAKAARYKAQRKVVPERRDRNVPKTWQLGWMELRTLGKWSGAATNPDVGRANSEGIFSDEDSDEKGVDDESSSVDFFAGAGDSHGRLDRDIMLTNSPPLSRKELKR